MVNHLLLERVWLGETNFDGLGGSLLVDFSNGVELAFNLVLVEGVQEQLHVLLSVKADAGVLASDGCGVHLNNDYKYKFTMSSRMASWTAVRVRLLGRF